MAHIPDFDLEDTLGVLYSVYEKCSEGSRERDVIELAQIALLYTRHLKKREDFAKYYKQFFDPSFEIKIAHEFETRADADRGLANGSVREDERVKIAGEGFMVVRLPGRLSFMVAPLPEELNSDEWKDDSE